MQFLYPQFLYALALVAIPVIIHLLQLRRYKKIVFSDVSLLRQLQEQNKQKHAIRDWVILALRALAIAMLVLAFARPYIPMGESKTKDAAGWVSFYLDNSLSMQGGNPESLLEIGKRKIEEALPAYSNSTRFQLLTNDFEGRHQRLVNKKDLMDLQATVRISPVSRSLGEVQRRQDALRSSMALGAGHVYWISDFQNGMQTGLKKCDSLVKTFLIPLAGSSVPNVWIDSACFPEPFLKQGTGNKIRCWIKNESKEDFSDQPLMLKVDEVQRAIRNVSVNAGSREAFEIEFSLADTTAHRFELSITDYPATFDDNYYLTGQARSSVHVLCLSDKQTFAEAGKLFGLDPFFRLNQQSLSGFDLSRLADFDAVILYQPGLVSLGVRDALKSYVERGGTLLMIPGEGAGVCPLSPLASELGLSIQEYLPGAMEVSKVEIKDPLFLPAFRKLPDNPRLPVFRGVWNIETRTANTSVLMHFANDAPALVRSSFGSGKAYLLAGPVDPLHSDFTSNALFVPLMLNLPLQTRSPFPSSYTMGKNSILQFQAKESVKLVGLQKGDWERKFNCTQRNNIANLILDEPLPEAGMYALDDGKIKLGFLAMNYPREESRQGFLNLDLIKEQSGALEISGDLRGFAGKLQQELNGEQFWRFFVLMALAFLLAEILLLRYWKK